MNPLDIFSWLATIVICGGTIWFARKFSHPSAEYARLHDELRTIAVNQLHQRDLSHGSDSTAYYCLHDSGNYIDLAVMGIVVLDGSITRPAYQSTVTIYRISPTRGKFVLHTEYVVTSDSFLDLLSPRWPDSTGETHTSSYFINAEQSQLVSLIGQLRRDFPAATHAERAQ